MNKRRILTVLIIVVLIILGWFASLFWYKSPSQSQPLQGAGPSPKELIKLNVRLAWQANANSAGQIVALARDFYREEGLDVTFNEGGIADPSVKTVAGGADDLGFANGVYPIVAARAVGAPLRIVAIIHQEGYHCFCARDNSGIQTPKDWVGRRVGVKPSGSATYYYYQMLIRKLEIDRSTISEVPVGYDVRPFLAEEVDVFPGARNNEALTIEGYGIRLKCISPEDYGIPTIGHVLFTTEAMLHAREDVVRRFVRATMRGWNWCRVPENRNAVIEYLVAYNPKIDRSKERRALDETLLLVGDGSINKNKLANIIDSQMLYGDLAHPVTVDEIIHPFPIH
jgi:ABC-type nitrate/sulfonate/bicarbonate transport systems, periplasmic components